MPHAQLRFTSCDFPILFTSIIDEHCQGNNSQPQVASILDASVEKTRRTKRPMQIGQIAWRLRIHRPTHLSKFSCQTMEKRDFDFRDGKREHLSYAFRLIGHRCAPFRFPISHEKRVEYWEPSFRINPLFANESASMAMTDLVPLFAFTPHPSCHLSTLILVGPW
jgi:hypothetical protein